MCASALAIGDSAHAKFAKRLATHVIALATHVLALTKYELNLQHT
jgi:hypothetical protein